MINLVVGHVIAILNKDNLLKFTFCAMIYDGIYNGVYWQISTHKDRHGRGTYVELTDGVAFQKLDWVSSKVGTPEFIDEVQWNIDHHIDFERRRNQC